MSRETQSLLVVTLSRSEPSVHAWMWKPVRRVPRSTSQVSTAASWALCSLHEEMEGPKKERC